MNKADGRRLWLWPARIGGILVGVPFVALTVAGCSTSTQEQGAGETALRFAATVSQDPQAACAELAPMTLREVEQNSKQPCSEALQEEQLPASTRVVRTVLAGTTALVELDGQTLFLARFDTGWKVVAAGCTHDSEDDATPYECPVKGT